MIFSKKEVRETCNDIAVPYDLDPKLIYAICLNESAKDENGNFDASVARLEQNYYRKYVKKMNLPTTTEVLLSASYGICQMMGLSLWELGYFEGKNVQQAIDNYCVNLHDMIDTGCRWFLRKLDKANGNIYLGLSYWNGDMSGKYTEKIISTYEKV